MKNIQFLIILIFILYFVGVFQLFNVGTFGIQPTYPILFIIYSLLFFKFITNKIEINMNPLNVVKIVLLLQVIGGLSYLYVITNSNADEIQFIKTYAHFIYLSLFAIVLGIFNYDNITWRKVIQIWLILSIVINVFGIYQLFARAFDLPLAWIELTNASLSNSETENYQQLSLQFQNFYRATSIFSEPSALAGFNLTILAFLIYPKFNSNTFQIFKSKNLINIIFILDALSLFITFSLTGVLGLFMLFCAYLVYNKGISIIKILRIVILIIIIIFISDIVIEAYFDTSLIDLFSKRIGNVLGLSNEAIVGESFTTRSNNFENALNIWMKSPIIGVGLGQLKYFGEFNFSDYAIMHSLAEVGVLGGGLFILMFIFLFIDLFLLRKSFDKLDSETVFLINACFYTLVILAVNNFVTGNSFIGLSLWVFIGFIISVITNAKRKLGYNTSPINFFKKKPHQLTDKA